MPAILAIQPFTVILAIDCFSPMRFGLQLCNVFRGFKKEKSKEGGYREENVKSHKGFVEGVGLDTGRITSIVVPLPNSLCMRSLPPSS